jgi:hypothetical protein
MSLLPHPARGVRPEYVSVVQTSGGQAAPRIPANICRVAPVQGLKLQLEESGSEGLVAPPVCCKIRYEL